MKQWVVGGVLIVFSLLVPQRKYDIGKLQPVEVIMLDKQDKTIIISTDTGHSGRGADVREAIQDLKDTTPGVVFMDTADYLIYTKEAEDAIQIIRPYLHEGVRVCQGTEGIDLQKAAEFLTIHEPKTLLNKWETQESVDLLDKSRGKLKLLRKNEKRC